MVKKLKAFWDLFHAGKQVADPKKWKNRTITVNAIVAVLVALGGIAYAFGYTLPEDTDYEVIAAAIIAVFNIIMHLTTSEKVGIPRKDTTNELQPVPEDTTQSETFPDDNSRD
jgi:uncharacterized membrane protein